MYPQLSEAALHEGARHRPDDAQRKAARIAGLLYLMTNATAVFGSAVTTSIVVRRDATAAAARAMAGARLARLGIASDLFTFAADIGPVVALYVVIRPVGRHLALLAAAWRLVETAVLVVCTLDGLVTLRLLGGAGEMKALAMVSIAAHAAGYIEAHAAGYNVGSYSWAWDRPPSARCSTARD